MVLVMNASYEALHTVSLKHAVKMLVREVAVVHETVSDTDFIGHLPRPKAIRLVKFIFPKWKHDLRHRSYSKNAVHERDKWTCAYCGGFGDTIDHIVPKARGGRATWMNSITACEDCNGRKKKSRTPEEAGMPLLFQPYDPGRRAW
jgi:5-methylcytosine-specific restriction endonuclease McrA